MERTHICGGCGSREDVGYLVDATIAALQAQLEQVQEERSKYIQAVGLATTCAADMQIDTSHPIEMMQEVCKRFTQRTAELNEIEKIVDIDSGKTLIEKVRDLKHSFKQVYDSYQDAANEMFKAQDERTAELEAVSNFIGVQYDAESRTWVSGQAPYQSAGTTKQEACIAAVDALRLACATWEMKCRDLQAELEAAKGKLDIILRVSRGEPDDELAVDYGGLGWENDPAVLGVYNLIAELERVRGQYEGMLAMVKALPLYKDISVSHRINEHDYESWHVWADHNPLAECDTEEEANAIKALYEHRQGMEG